MAVAATGKKGAFNSDREKLTQSLKMFGAPKPARRAPSAKARKPPKKPTDKP